MDKTERLSDSMIKDHAQVIVPPPFVYILSLVTGSLVHFLWEPLSPFPAFWIGHAAGWPVIVVAGLLAVWAVRTMLRAGESPDVYKPTGAIVATGPYALSRNPMYVSLTLLYVGITLIVNTVWPIVFLPAGLIFMHYGVIAREESYLERVFGDGYAQYRAKVRRWL